MSTNSYNLNTKPIKVLFVGGGRRVSLAKRFLANGCRLFSYEDDVNCPISEFADIIKGLRWKDPGIKNHINCICSSLGIDIIIPLQDEAIPICCDLVSPCPASFNAAQKCFDKLEFARCMVGYDEYPTALENHKVIVKPRFGFSSKGIYVTDFDKAFKDVDFERFVLQRYIEGTEYSVDCYFNKKSELVGYVPRKRIVVQGGEVVQSVTMNRKDSLYHKFGSFIHTAFSAIGAVGPYCIQFIENNGNIYIIEANARFGGGVILSLEAGFDIISFIINEYIYGDKVFGLGTEGNEDQSWKEDLAMTRYFSEHFYDNDSKVF